MSKKNDYTGLYIIAMGLILVLLILSAIFAPMVGKYQVCKNYFPEINRYACLWTTLPPYTGVKK